VNTARVEIEKDGVVIYKKEEVLDPLAALWTPGPHAHAETGMNVGTQIDFGRIKVGAWVKYECDQNEKTVDAAGEAAFGKALEFMNSALAILGETPK
jgi:hypothetical protein